MMASVKSIHSISIDEVKSIHDQINEHVSSLRGIAYLLYEHGEANQDHIPNHHLSSIGVLVKHLTHDIEEAMEEVGLNE
jgi:hypothetical protein